MDARKFNHAGFHEYLNEQKLMGSRCTQCQEMYLPPRSLCVQCYSTQMEWTEFSGQGTIAGITTIYVGPTSMCSEGYNRENPYCAAVVQLEEGPSISGQVLSDGPCQAENLPVGTPVRATFIERGSDENRKVHLAFEKIPDAR